MAYVDVRQPVTKRLLFRFDPDRDIIEIVERGVKTFVDLNEYRAPESAREIASERQTTAVTDS
jgi:hypothetical protein